MKIMGNNFEKKMFQSIDTVFTYSLPESYYVYKVEEKMHLFKTLFARSQASVYVQSTVQQTAVS